MKPSNAPEIGHIPSRMDRSRSPPRPPRLESRVDDLEDLTRELNGQMRLLDNKLTQFHELLDRLLDSDCLRAPSPGDSDQAFAGIRGQIEQLKQETCDFEAEHSDLANLKSTLNPNTFLACEDSPPPSSFHSSPKPKSYASAASVCSEASISETGTRVEVLMGGYSSPISYAKAMQSILKSPNERRFSPSPVSYTKIAQPSSKSPNGKITPPRNASPNNPSSAEKDTPTRAKFIPPHLRSLSINKVTSPLASVKFIPPHLRSLSTDKAASPPAPVKFVPPHLRSIQAAPNVQHSDAKVATTEKNDHKALATDGPIDTSVSKPKSLENLQFPVPPTAAAFENTFKELTDDTWMPRYIIGLDKLPQKTLDYIPGPDAMVTFSIDFLTNILGGEVWSPGLRFIKPGGPCPMKSRTYYLMDPTIDPYLPRAAGEHGAKLTAFFNKSPSDDYPDEDFQPYVNVPMFLGRKDTNGRIRYTYFGHYTQTRWSDKLDHDTMSTRVPLEVKRYWARQLTTEPRDQWVTDALCRHFSPKPEYNSRLLDLPEPGSSEAARKQIEDLFKDIQEYVGDLHYWKKQSEKKMSEIDEDFILCAFEQAEADTTKSLRLWWEYLECVNWDRKFYDTLDKLQSRESQYFE